MHSYLSSEGNLIAMKLAVESHGNGEPLVLIHGLGSAATAWKPLTKLLVNDFQVNFKIVFGPSKRTIIIVVIAFNEKDFILKLKMKSIPKLNIRMSVASIKIKYIRIDRKFPRSKL
jgi:hypothetical protein